jgi:hypothetical protein
MPSNNSLPYEIIAAPYDVYYAPVGTTFPLIDAVPAAAWLKVGTSLSLNYLDDGVKVSHSQKIRTRFARSATRVPGRSFRTEEDLMIALTLADSPSSSTSTR